MPEEAVRDSGTNAGNAVAAPRARPLSPHLQIYRPQITSVLSITHRLTGVALAVGSILLVWWLVVLAAGSEARYLEFNAFLRGPIGLLLMLGWTWALFFHLANGVRHLFWDAGLGFDLAAMTRSGWAVVIASAGLTLLAWAAGFAVLGARP
jgi:succinate dehydrogenase / fumarate reductase cytochrome b subunit